MKPLRVMPTGTTGRFGADPRPARRASTEAHGVGDRCFSSIP
jgi:hypothetical protein